MQDATDDTVAQVTAQRLETFINHLVALHCIALHCIANQIKFSYTIAYM